MSHIRKEINSLEVDKNEQQNNTTKTSVWHNLECLYDKPKIF